MPNTDFITRLLNLKESDIDFLETIVKEDTVYYDLKLKSTLKECPYCHGELISNGYGRTKSISHSSLTDYKNIILFRPKRFLCKQCGKTVTQECPFSFEGFKTSYALIRSVMKKLSNLNYTLKMISDELHISSTQINTYLDSYVTVPARPLPVCLGIDEVHSPQLAYKGSAYLCVMVDNENRSVYDVLGSRSKSYLDNYFYGFRQEEKDAVKYVTIDMWAPYKDLSYKHFRNCIVAVDPFHVVEHLCKDFEAIRISIMNQMVYGSNAYYLLKNWNWLLTSDDVNLDNEPVYNNRFKTKLNRRQILKMIMDLSPVLEEAYVLKEKYRSFNRNMSYEDAKYNYEFLLEEFEQADIPEYREFTSILRNWKSEILNSFLRPYEDRKLSNAFCENINGKIDAYLIISRGIANFSRFRKRVLFALNPKIFYALTDRLYSEKRKGKKRGPYRKITE